MLSFQKQQSISTENEKQIRRNEIMEWIHEED